MPWDKILEHAAVKNWLPRDVWGMAWDDFVVVFQFAQQPIGDAETLEWVNRERLKRGLKKVSSLKEAKS